MEPIQLYKHLGEETRLRILLLITAEDELCVCELTAATGESQPKISRHLGLLREAGLLEDERRGKWVFYRIGRDVEAWAREILATTLKSAPYCLVEDQKRLAAMGSRPERMRHCSA